MLVAWIATLLDDSPCYVAFSGGCDSSLILAAAVVACRRVGHDPPIAVTYRVAGAAQSEDREFQALVISHLGHERQWRVFDVDDGIDLLGPCTTETLGRSGLIWPATALSAASVYEQLEPGLFLTGEGGDEVLGLRRCSLLAEAARHVVRGHRVPPAALLSGAAAAIAPRARRERAGARTLRAQYTAAWLRPDLRDSYLARAAALEAAEPLRPARWFAHHLSLPRVAFGMRSLRDFAATYGMRWHAPLLAPEFLGALANAAHWYEYRGRVILLRHHFAELLPRAVVERTSKALFTDAYFGPATKTFARDWDGTGVPDGVDAAWLRQNWLSAAPHGGTALLVHHAWLSTHAVVSR